MTTKLEEILTKIHQELVISNMPTTKHKELQREVFEKEDRILSLESYQEIVERDIQTWITKNIKDNKELSDKEIETLIPKDYKLLNDIIIAIKELEKDLESYKDCGVVVRAV